VRPVDRLTHKSWVRLPQILFSALWQVLSARARLERLSAGLVAALEGSELSGEAGRQFANGTKRQLLAIERTLAALGRRYVLVDQVYIYIYMYIERERDARGARPPLRAC